MMTWDERASDCAAERPRGKTRPPAWSVDRRGDSADANACVMNNHRRGHLAAFGSQSGSPRPVASGRVLLADANHAVFDAALSEARPSHLACPDTSAGATAEQVE